MLLSENWFSTSKSIRKVRAMRIALIIVMSVLAIVFTVGAAGGAGYAPKPGKRHPDFTLPDIHTGKPVSLSDFRGQKVLLIQFASW